MSSETINTISTLSDISTIIISTMAIGLVIDIYSGGRNTVMKWGMAKSPYEILEKRIRYLSTFVTWILIGIPIYSVFLAYNGNLNIDKAELCFKLYVPLLAVLLAAEAADRQLKHKDRERKEDEKIDIDRVSHHLIFVLGNLINMVNYMTKMLNNGGYSYTVLHKTGILIEKRFEIFFDRDLYRYLQPESVELIHNMSASIFGLCARSTHMVNMKGDKAFEPLPIPNKEDPEHKPMIKSLEQLLKEFTTLDEQIRKLKNLV